MTGFSNYSAQSALNWTTGNNQMPPYASRFLALYSTAPTADDGTSAVEPPGNGYARQQIAGQLTASGAWALNATSMTLSASAPAWLLALGTNGSGCNIYSLTKNAQIGTVTSITGATVNMTAAASASQGTTDTVYFSAFAPATGSGLASAQNGAAIAFPQATGAGWGTLVAFGLYDAVTAGNFLNWDYLGANSWNPCTISAASPGVFTVKNHGYAATDNVVYSTEYGGTAPSFSQSNLTGLLAVVSPVTDTFTVTNAGTAVNTSSTGSGMVRKVASQAVPAGVTATFAANAITLQAA